MLGDGPEMEILLCGSHLGRSARNRSCPWRHDDRSIRVARGDSCIAAVLIIGAVAGERSERIGELVEKRPSPETVVNVSSCQLNGDDLAAVAIDAEMQLAPGSPSGSAVLLKPDLNSGPI